MERKSIVINGQIYLYGDVGQSSMFVDDAPYFTDEDVALALAEVGPRDVTARINSGGGKAFMGMAIYSLLKAHAGKVTTVVDGAAASAASLIAMAGSERQMRNGAMLMIHDPASITFGSAKDHEETAKNLDKLADNYAAVYALASGKPVKDVRDQMLAETWMTAKEAVAQGYATGMVDEAAEPVAAFDYRLYTKSPANLIARVNELQTAARQRADEAAVVQAAGAAVARMRMRNAAI